MEFRWELGILLLLPIATLQLSDSSSLSYVGAVAEYNPVTRPIDNQMPADLNAENYLKFIKKASEYSADILIFPESSLSISTSKERGDAASYIPDPKDRLVLCDNDTYASSLSAISCGARNHRIYVVVNHKEKVDCRSNSTGCPEDNLLIYNTNVAFDREGRVVARYRKYNLFGEIGTNVTEDDVLSTFDTDFGVKFGQFICFDLLFPQPALNYTRQMGVKDIIFSNHWFSELPHLFSVQAQAGWSYANDVNFLASGYNNPKSISGGSGIFIGRKGYSHVVMEAKASNMLVVSEIPKLIDGERLANVSKARVYEFSKSEINTSETVASQPYVPLVNDLTVYTTKAIDLKQNLHDEVLCDRELCCDFKFNVTFDQNIAKDNEHYYKYRLAVFNGTRSFSGVASGGIKTCGIISCTNDNLSSCGGLLDPSAAVFPTTFHSIEITTGSVSNENAFFMPVSISSDLQPLNASDYTFATRDAGNGSTHGMALRQERNDLVTFAIFGRNFDTDGTDVTTSSSAGHFLCIPLVISIIGLISIY